MAQDEQKVMATDLHQVSVKCSVTGTNRTAASR